MPKRGRKNGPVTVRSRNVETRNRKEEREDRRRRRPGIKDDKQQGVVPAPSRRANQRTGRGQDPARFGEGRSKKKTSGRHGCRVELKETSDRATPRRRSEGVTAIAHTRTKHASLSKERNIKPQEFADGGGHHRETCSHNSCPGLAAT